MPSASNTSGFPDFYPQDVRLSPQAFVLGGSNSFALRRESLELEERIIIGFQVTAAAATLNTPDGAPAILKSVLLTGSSGQGGSINPVNLLSGADLFEYAQPAYGALPPIETTAGTPATLSTGFYRFEIPINHVQWSLPEPLRYMTALKAYEMSDLTLQLNWAAQSDIDSNATPLFAISNAFVQVIQKQVYRETVPTEISNATPNFWAKQLFEVKQYDSSIVTNPTFLLELSAGGLYQSIMMRAYASTTAKQVFVGASGAAGPIVSGTNQDNITLNDLSTRIKKATSALSLRAENLRYYLDNLVPGNAAFLFNRSGIASAMFDTGQINKTTANIQLITNVITPAAGGKIRLVTERIFPAIG